mmetsp:Transcript_16487/g.18309  ORF Transcript_16487/g.18309 Transcript_16487/m.18309 type:complete len:224 (+) Transcript_16487:109-780(+)
MCLQMDNNTTRRRRQDQHATRVLRTIVEEEDRTVRTLRIPLNSTFYDVVKSLSIIAWDIVSCSFIVLFREPIIDPIALPRISIHLLLLHRVLECQPRLVVMDKGHHVTTRMDNDAMAAAVIEDPSVLMGLTFQRSLALVTAVLFHIRFVMNNRYTARSSSSMSLSRRMLFHTESVLVLFILILFSQTFIWTDNAEANFRLLFTLLGMWLPIAVISTFLRYAQR